MYSADISSCFVVELKSPFISFSWRLLVNVDCIRAPCVNMWVVNCGNISSLIAAPHANYILANDRKSMQHDYALGHLDSLSNKLIILE